MSMYYEWQPYVPVAKRRADARRELSKLEKKGQKITPVILEGRKIATTFWGKAWCDNLERYSDFSNRLPRGRTYVRNGSVVDLKVSSGEAKALVSGSSMYKVSVQVEAVPKSRWKTVCHDCSGAIDSLVELLQGRFSKGVMERLCTPQTGLFPSPKEISFSCSCPDWASMCKHVAAVLYGIGARFDTQPELLFTLRNVNHEELIAGATQNLPLSKTAPKTEKVLQSDDLSALFGLEMNAPEEAVSPTPNHKQEKTRTRKSTAVPGVSSSRMKPKTVSRSKGQTANGTAKQSTRSRLRHSGKNGKSYEKREEHS